SRRLLRLVFMDTGSGAAGGDERVIPGWRNGSLHPGEILAGGSGVMDDLPAAGRQAIAPRPYCVRLDGSVLLDFRRTLRVSVMRNGLNEWRITACTGKKCSEIGVLIKTVQLAKQNPIQITE